MAEFILKNKIFKFIGKVKQQLMRTTVGTKFAPSYTYIYMYEIEEAFLKTQDLQSLWFQYIHHVFFYME